MAIEVLSYEGELSVKVPYNPDFINRAKRLGGTFHEASKAWVFDARTEDSVKGLCREIFGADGPCDEVDVRVTYKGEKPLSSYSGSIYVAGRQVARAFAKDSGAKPGEGCAFIKGRVTSGGSTKNWVVMVCKDATIEILDLPKAALELIDSTEWDIEVVRERPLAPPEEPQEPVAPTLARECTVLVLELFGSTNIIGVFAGEGHLERAIQEGKARRGSVGEGRLNVIPSKLNLP